MAETSAVNGNPFNLSVIEEFRANQGRVGGSFEGVPLLLLTTKGARTGLVRTTPLVHLADPDRFVVLASNGGAPKAPAWFHNLMAAGEATVEVGAERLRVRPVLVDEAEHDELWARAAAINPDFTEYRTRSNRTIPMVALVRA
ncbi:nitroreductase/quinone reductase family protein [Kitasatospora sp. HPMI-4]|uniref:nitroreductase/quinone reductase family protein n=1 Tax=Kitasatospora sp. HPMI-4 TaxID=3448443 RepID=UPI003F1B77CA